MANNPKQRLILHFIKDCKKGNDGMFCKTLDRAKEILLQRNPLYLERAMFYDGEGVATKLI